MYLLLAPYLHHTNTQAVPGLSGDYLRPPHHHCVRVPQNVRVTPAVPGLSWDDYPTLGTPLAEYPRTPELHRQSQDCPGMTTQPPGTPLSEYPRTPEYTGSPGMTTQPPVRVSQNTGVTPAVLGLSWDGYPTPGTCLPEYPSYTCSPGIVPG